MEKILVMLKGKQITGLKSGSVEFVLANRSYKKI